MNRDQLRSHPRSATLHRKSASQPPLRRREMDSNHRSPVAGKDKRRNQIFRKTTGGEAYLRRNKAADRLVRRAPNPPSRNLPPSPFPFRHRRGGSAGRRPSSRPPYARVILRRN